MTLRGAMIVVALGTMVACGGSPAGQEAAAGAKQAAAGAAKEAPAGDKESAVAEEAAEPVEAKAGDTVAPAWPAEAELKVKRGPNTGGETPSVRVEVSWTAATDEVGVVAYEVSSDGAVLAKVDGAQTSAVMPLPPPDPELPAALASRVSFTVSAVDAAGNRSESPGAASWARPNLATISAGVGRAIGVKGAGEEGGAVGGVKPGTLLGGDGAKPALGVKLAPRGDE